MIIRLATKQHVPVAGHRREWAEKGAPFSYAENIREVGRAVINVRTAKALGLTIPPSMLELADYVIE